MPKSIIRYSLFFLLMASLACSKSVEQASESIVYLKRVNGNFDIYQSDLVGQWERRLTSNPGWDWQPQWNRALHGLIYYSIDSTEHFWVVKKNLGTEESERLPYSELLNFQLSPSGKHILFVEKNQEVQNIKMCPIDDPNSAIELTTGQFYNGRFTMSQDESLMAFISNRDGANQLYMMDMKSKLTTQLTKGHMIAKYSSFSPDAKQIAVTLAQPSDNPVWDIYIVDLETKEIHQLTKTPYSEQEISWSPSGKKIAFHGTSDNDGDQIYTIDFEDGRFTKITSGDFYHGEPAWLPFSY